MKNISPIIQIGNVLISADCLTEKFCCDISACQGACCVEGDAGAPVTLDEIAQLEEVLPVVWADLSASAQALIDKQGVAYTDVDGELVTSIVNGKDCVFTCHDNTGCCFCAVEKAYREGKTTFYKPLSCHLYPIRVSQVGDCKALNLHRWDVCRAAALKGRREQVSLYRFLKEPLVRAFGAAWYAELEKVAAELEAQGFLS